MPDAYLVIAIPTMGLLALCAAAGFRPPTATDEVDYHWPAPVLWADAGRWVTTPYRFTNGFHLAEVVYTPAAVFGSSTAAHWVHLLTFLLLALGAAALARSLRAPGVLAACSVVAIPAAAGQSWLAFNDIFAASLLIAACVAVADDTDRRRLWAAGILLAGGGAKPLIIVLCPAVLLVVLYGRRMRGEPVLAIRGRRSLVPLVVPGIAVCGAWLAYTRSFTGSFFQSSGVVVSVFGDDPTNGLATLRLPTALDAVVAPFLPMATGIIGQREPYGGRTGLVLTVFIPIALVTAFLMKRRERRELGRLAVPAVVGYLLAAIVLVRTRYLMALYPLALASIALVVPWWREQRGRTSGLIVLWLFRACVVLGLLDTARQALR